MSITVFRPPLSSRRLGKMNLATGIVSDSLLVQVSFATLVAGCFGSDKLFEFRSWERFALVEQQLHVCLSNDVKIEL